MLGSAYKTVQVKISYLEAQELFRLGLKPQAIACRPYGTVKLHWGDKQ